MKKIMMASLKSDGTKDINGNDVVFFFDESDEAPMSDTWGGDVSGYVDNYIEVSRDINGAEFRIVEGVSVRDVPYGSIVIGNENGYPSLVFWSADVEDETDE